MRNLALLILLLPTVCFGREFIFTYNFQEDGVVKTVKYETEAETWKTAHDRGAVFCFDFFANQKSFDEDRLVRIIDSCSNPSESKQ